MNEHNKETLKDSAEDPWTQVSSLKELTRHDIWELRKIFLDRHWPEVRGMKVLEVGSGPGHDSLSLAGRGAEITAVDYSLNALALGRRFYSEQDKSINLVCGNVMHLPFLAHSFDFVFNAGVLEHFEDDALKQVIGEMIRVARPGGWVLAFCPNRYNIYYQYYLRHTRYRQYEYERSFGAWEIRDRFRVFGLKDIRVSGVHIHPAFNYILPGWLPKHHRLEPLSRKLFSRLEKFDGMHRLKSLIGQDFVVWGKKDG